MNKETESRKCPVCQVSTGDLEMHLKIHQAICSSCQKVQVDRVALKKHEKNCKSVQKKIRGHEESNSSLLLIQIILSSIFFENFKTNVGINKYGNSGERKK